MQGVYQRNAQTWDEQRSRTLLEKGWLDKFVSSLPAGGDILDVGCGSGEPIAKYLIDQGFNITGSDAAPAMIEICARRYPKHSWASADMRTLDLGCQVDGIVAWDSFFHLNPDEQRSTLQRFLDHLRPGGALMLTIGHESGEVLGAVAGEQVYHSSLDPEEYKSILNAAGYRHVEIVFQDKSCGDRTVLLTQQ